jgi:hypothetical protein
MNKLRGRGAEESEFELGQKQTFFYIIYKVQNNSGNHPVSYPVT